MLNLVTGSPGSSKTAYVVTQLDKIERNNKINLQKNKLIWEHNLDLFKKYHEDFEYIEVQTGSGHLLKTEYQFLPEDYFTFLSEDFDDLRPDYYYQRSMQYNTIIERISERDGSQGFKLFKPVRTIYTNINNLKIDFVRSHIFDWRESPDGSIHVIDEVQLVEPYSNVKSTNEPIVQELTTHRHRGFDFYFITQYPRLAHPTVRDLIGVHFHITRPYGRTPKVYRFGSCRAYPNTTSNKINCESKFSFKPHDRIFKLYKSTSIDTHQKRYPKGALTFLAFILFGVATFVYSITTGTKSSLISEVDHTKKDTKTTSNKKDSPQSFSSHTQHTSPTPDDLKTMIIQETFRPAMVISSGDSCRAYNSSGSRLNISNDVCMAYSDKPVTIPISSLDHKNPYDYQDKRPIPKTDNVITGTKTPSSEKSA